MIARYFLPRRISVKTLRLVFAACLVLALAAACGGRKEEEAAAPAAPAGGGTPFDPATGTATVSGKIAFEGGAPEAAQIKMSADPVCMSLHKEPVYSEQVLMSDGKLQNVFVYVKEGLEKYTFTPP